MQPNQDLSPRQKAAILIMSLPPELSAQVLQSFPAEEGQALTLEMSKTANIPQEVKDQVIKEFLETSKVQGQAHQQPQNLPSLSRRGEDIEPRRSYKTGKPFAFLLRADPGQILTLLEKELPQTIALVLSNLSAAQATAVLQEMSPHLQGEVARRLAEIGRVRSEILKDVEQVLEDRYYLLVENGFSTSTGKDTLMQILNRTDRSTEEKILSGLARKSPKLANNLKNQLCEFEDLVALDKSGIQQLLKVTDIRDLVMALKGTSPEISNKIYDAMSSEKAQAVREDVEALGPPSWEEVKAAQQQIRNNLRGLIIIGKIKFSSPGVN